MDANELKKHMPQIEHLLAMLATHVGGCPQQATAGVAKVELGGKLYELQLRLEPDKEHWVGRGVAASWSPVTVTVDGPSELVEKVLNG
jgi:hypothetical protein